MMNEQELKQTLHDIAAEAVPADTDIWPALHTQFKTRKRPFSRRVEPLLRLASAGAALAVVAFFLLWLAGLPQMMAPQPAASPSAQPVGDFDVIAAPVAYPDAPSELPSYHVRLMPGPDSPAAALTWAEAFGLPDARLFRDTHIRNAYSPEALIALGSDGSRLFFQEADGGGMPVGYQQRHDWDDMAEGETLSLDAATTAAETFLSSHGLLAQPYQVRDLLPYMFMADGYPPRQLLVGPDLNGYALYGSGNAAVGASLLLDPTGEVFSAGFLEAAFEELGTMPIRPAEEVVADFVNGRLDPIQLQIIPVDPGYRDLVRYYPPLPTHTIGEAVTILETDDTHFLVAEDGSEIRATLRTGTGGNYDLITPDLPDIVAQIENDVLLVTGTISAQTADDTWQLEVASWQTMPQQTFTFSGCVVGKVEMDADGAAWVVAEAVMGRLTANDRYHIRLPDDIPTGEIIEVCSSRQLEASEPLAWEIIYTPPRWDFYADSGLQEPAAIELAASPYQLGETAVLTGVVANELYQISGVETPSLWLIADLPGEEIGHIYPLVGDAAQLQTLNDSYLGQTVQLTGTITTTGAADGEQALAVSAVSQPWAEPPSSAYAEKVLLTLSQMELDNMIAEAVEVEATQSDETLVVEEVELAYYFDPAGDGEAAVPVWVVRGHSQDGQNRFMAYLPANEF